MTKNELGRDMMSGEFESATALWNSLPEFTPKPIAWGKYLADPETYFYICEFHEMTDELPDVTKFCAKLARLHLNSIPLSPQGQYGFHATTYVGTVPQDNTWSDTWEGFFTRALKHHLNLEERVQGPDEEMKKL